jgi:hypothetical protein
MPDALLTKIQKQLSDRLRELEGVVAEYESLQQVARALDGARGSSAGRTPARTTTTRRATTRRATTRRATAPRKRATRKAAAGSSARRASAGRRTTGRRRATGATRGARAPARGGAGKRAPRGANRDAILGALRGRGRGTVASELAKLSGVGRVSSYQVLTRLEKEGLVRRREQPTGPALYTLP